MQTAKLTIYFIPSPRRINWTTPTTLARTILTNKLARKRRFMGHVNIELEYEENGEKKHYLTGMAAQNLNAVPLILKEKMGLGILFHSFAGKLESKEELIPELTGYFKEGNESINFIEYEIDLAAAKRVETYLHIFKEKKLDRYYGLFNSPLHAEGGGCSAFGASVLEVAGLLNQDHKHHWTRVFQVPHRLVGAPLTKNKTSFFKLLLTQQDWAEKDEDFTEIFFWDPDLMHLWVENQLKEDKYEIKNKEKARGIFISAVREQEYAENIFKNGVANDLIQSIAPDLHKKTNRDKYL